MASAAEKTSRLLLLALLLAMAWMFWSGLFKPLLIAFGVFSCVLSVYLAARMDYFDNETFAIHVGWRLLKYWVWLSKEIVKSSLDVARIVLHPKLPISPRVVDIRPTATRPVYQVILANSITLTPGTLSLDVYNGVIKVHALTEQGAEDLIAGEMDRRVADLRED
ncbi:MAG: Na+/H+ antiporter subunit E [Pseudomonadota bacterium]